MWGWCLMFVFLQLWLWNQLAHYFRLQSEQIWQFATDFFASGPDELHSSACSLLYTCRVGLRFNCIAAGCLCLGRLVLVSQALNDEYMFSHCNLHDLLHQACRSASSASLFISPGTCILLYLPFSSCAPTAECYCIIHRWSQDRSAASAHAVTEAKQHQSLTFLLSDLDDVSLS